MSPAAFWGLLTTLVLAGIYFFRRQSKTVKVSSLMFFTRIRHSAEGGRRLTRLQTPLILLLEIVVLILLVLAAANPRVISGEKLISVVLILDDSLSMNVNDPESPRKAAINYLEDSFFSRAAYRFTLIRTGTHPEIIGRHDMAGNEAAMLIENWRCTSPAADIFMALRYVAESLSPDAQVFVITDQPAAEKQQGKAGWLSFGSSLPNQAITAASRYALGDVDRCFVEFTSFASQPARLDAEILLPESGAVIERISETMLPRATRRLRFVLKDTAARVMIRINNDPVTFDNIAWLLPVRPAPVEVEVHLASEYRRRFVEKALASTGLARVVASSSQLLVADEMSSFSAEGLWRFHLHVASQPAGFSGTVAIDREHPLMAGIPGVKAAWAIDPGFIAPGMPLMTGADIPLLAVSGEPWENLLITLNLSPEYSDLQKSPAWPVLFWNLLNWRQQHNPGPIVANFRSGSNIEMALPPETSTAALYDPAGRKIEDAAIWRNRAVFQSSSIGLFEIRAGIASWPVAINLCSPAESDLTVADHAPPPSMPLSGNAMHRLADVRWWFLLPALLLMVMHLWLASFRRSANAAY